jgi:hypothetical protein
MILGEPILGDAALAAGNARPDDATRGQSRITLDQLFRGAAARRPDAVALVDAPNRASFTGGRALRLSYAEADRIVSAIAGRLRQMGLPTDAIIGIQLPHTVENVLTILGVLRAGMIAAPLPLLWRRADTVAALVRVGAKAIITCERAGDFSHSQFATRVAAEVFSIRYVCGFGGNVPDGVVGFDDLFAAAALDPIPPLERKSNAAAHIAVISFEVGENGPVPVARRHLELLAGGLGILLECRLLEDAAILSTLAPASFAGLCLTLVPWLLTGGTLVLHHPFDVEIFLRQRREDRCGTLILPAPVALRIAGARPFADDAPTTIVAPWHAPEQLADSADWPERDAVLVDVPIFGEAGLVATRRGANGRPVPLPLGRIAAPYKAAGALTVAELGMTKTATVALRGPMVPRHAFPPGIERSDQPHFAIGSDGWVDTGYPCRVDATAKTVTVTGPPSGIVTIGGYRLPLPDLLAKIRRIDGAATLTAVPDPLVGQRLLGNTADCTAMTTALNALGVNPLVATAFISQGERVLREAMSADMSAVA